MDHGDVRNEVLFLEVFVKASQLMYEEHAFINDGPGGQRADVCVVVGLFEDPADHIEFAVEVDAGLAVLRFFDETLLDEGHLVDRFLPESLGTGRDFTPAEELEALFGGDDLEHLLRLGTAQFVLRQEEHADAVFPFIAKCDAALSGFLFEERVGRCYDDADAVTGLPGRVFARAVLQLLDDLQRAVGAQSRAEQPAHCGHRHVSVNRRSAARSHSVADEGVCPAHSVVEVVDAVAAELSALSDVLVGADLNVVHGQLAHRRADNAAALGQGGQVEPPAAGF